MKTLRGSLVLCATICSILSLALLAGVAINGSGLTLYSHGLDPIPLDPDGTINAHGLDPIPLDPDGTIITAHGLDPIPLDPDGTIL